MTKDDPKNAAAEARELAQSAIGALGGLFSLGAREFTSAADAVRRDAAKTIGPAMAPVVEAATPVLDGAARVAQEGVKIAAVGGAVVLAGAAVVLAGTAGIAAGLAEALAPNKPEAPQSDGRAQPDSPTGR